MTTMGGTTETTAHPVGPQRAPGKARVAVLCVLVLGAVGAGWEIVHTRSDGAVPNSKRPVPVVGVTPTEPLTEAQSFTADWYFPGQREIDQDGFRARRSGAGQGTDCSVTLQDRTQDILHGDGCQAYVTASFTSQDQKVLGSVTVLRFADAAAAEKAAGVLRSASPDAVAFVPPDGASPAPSPQPGAAAAKPPTVSRIRLLGHYLTVTATRYADGHVADPALETAARAVAFTADQPFLWM